MAYAVAQWAALIAIVFLALALVCALAEGAARLRQWLKYGTPGSYAAMYRTDDTIGLRVLKAGYHSGAVSINSAGFRGPELTTPKPAQVLRIAYLGASTTFCAEVSRDDLVWPQLVTERLRKEFPNTAFDFVNAGVPGYTVASSRLNLKHRVAALKPDIIVVYHATNDLSGEVRDLAVARGLAGAAESGRQSWLEQHSLLWELVVKNLRVMQAQRAAAAHVSQLTIDAAALGAGFGGELSSLLKEAAGPASRVAVATFSTQLRAEQTRHQQERAALSAFVYMPFMSIEGLISAYRRYNDIISAVASREGALLIEGETNIPGDAAHFVDNVHFNDAGSRAMADRVYASLTHDAKVLELIRSRSRGPAGR